MAVAYSLANDEASLDRLRENFAPKMTGTPDASAFAVLSQSIDLHGAGLPRRRRPDRFGGHADSPS